MPSSHRGNIDAIRTLVSRIRSECTDASRAICSKVPPKRGQTRLFPHFDLLFMAIMPSIGKHLAETWRACRGPPVGQISRWYNHLADPRQGLALRSRGSRAFHAALYLSVQPGVPCRTTLTNQLCISALRKPEPVRLLAPRLPAFRAL